MIDDRDVIADELRRSLEGHAWHGPALLETFRDVDARLASARPLRGAHAIGEIVLHCASWMREVARRLDGAAPALPSEGDWPSFVSGEQAWRDAQQAVVTAAAALQAALARFPREKLDDVVGGGSQATFRVMLHGVAQHNAYHGGQIALLRRGLHG